MTVDPLKGRPVLWQPTPRQAEFLARSELEVLYGGAAGGGKTDALLIDALCLQAGGVYHPAHRALLIRRSFRELRDMIDRAKMLYPLIVTGARFNESDCIWDFPGGAKVEFGYLQHDSDRFKYRGRAWNYIGFDELTLWPRPTAYTYLMSRCRTVAAELPRYMRATTNPDGPGQVWVMERWGIDAAGGPTCIPVDIRDRENGVVKTIERRFIPARLNDNPYLAEQDYREILLQLPPDDRAALLEGRWEARSIEGAYFGKEMQMLRQNGQITYVPYDPSAPVNTFWDLGWNDTTAIWCHQFIAGEHRFFRCYENSGESIEHYIQVLQDMRVNLIGGVHYLPHDAANGSLQTGRSVHDILCELVPNLTFEIVPRTPSVLASIQATRLKLGGRVYIDSEGCVDGIAALFQYRKKYNEKLDCFTDKPVHDQASNYADAFRLWGELDQQPGRRRRRRLSPGVQPRGGMAV